MAACQAEVGAAATRSRVLPIGRGGGPSSVTGAPPTRPVDVIPSMDKPTVYDFRWPRGVVPAARGMSG